MYAASGRGEGGAGEEDSLAHKSAQVRRVYCEREWGVNPRNRFVRITSASHPHDDFLHLQ